MQELVTPLKGIDKDNHELNQDSQTYTFAYNANIEDFSGDSLLIGNEPSNLLTIVLNPNEDVIQKLTIVELSKVLLFTVEGSINRIREINPIKYTDYFQNHEAICPECVRSNEDLPLEKKPLVPLSSSKVLLETNFNWSINYSLSVQYKRTDCTLNLYFTDNHNPDRYLYFDLVKDELLLNENFKLIVGETNCEPIYEDKLDVSKTEWYNKIEIPKIETEIVNGGNLKAGVYQVLVAFATKQGIALSSYLNATDSIPIFTKDTTVEQNYETSKALRITLNNVQTKTKYQYINIVVAETFKGFTEYKLINTIPVSVSQYIYTGDESAIGLTESEIFQFYPFYKHSENISIANNTLFKINPVEYEKINVQKIANKLQGKLEWCTVVLKEGDFKKPEIAQKYKSYLRDEIYTFGLRLILDRTEFTPAGIIPNRFATEFEKELIINTPNIDDTYKDKCDNQLKKRWQVYNTAYKTYTANLVYDECNPQLYEKGEFGYFESTDRYPNNPDLFGEFCNQPILLYKFPDNLVTNFHNGTEAVKVGFNQENYIFPLGVKLKDDVNLFLLLDECVQEGIITQEQRNSIKGYQLVRGNRAGSETIDASGLIFNTYEYERQNTVHTYSNYPFNDLNPDPFIFSFKPRQVTIGSQVITIDKLPIPQTYVPNRKYTFHSPETSFSTPSLGNILKIESEEFGEAEGYFSEAQDQAKFKILSNQHYNLAIILGTILGEAIEFDDGSAQSANMGQGIGNIVGGAIGSAIAPGVGTSIGSSLGGVLGGLVGGAISKNDNLQDFWRANVILSQCEKLLQLFTLLSTERNYAYQYQAVGKYSNSKAIENNGNKNREIVYSTYLKPNTYQSLTYNNKNVFFNNFQRESSVYLELEKELPKPSIIDNSRFKPDCNYKSNQRVKTQVSSYYARIKNSLLNPYGSINNIEWLVCSQPVSLEEKPLVFGGDTYIGRMSLKRKHSYFTRTAYALPNNSEFFYEDYYNVANPTFFLNTRWNDENYINFNNPTNNPLMSLILNSLTSGVLPSDIISGVINTSRGEADPLLLLIPGIGIPLFLQDKQDAKFVWRVYLGLLGVFFKQGLLSPFNFIKPPKYNLDCFQDSFNKETKFFNTSTVYGKMYLYSYGIPYFLCESSINLDLRHAEDSMVKSFYPVQSNLDEWLQEKNVSLREDNYYTYNKDYSKQNKQQIVSKYDAIVEECQLKRTNRLIYSQQGTEIEDSTLKDSHLDFKALDYKDFDLKRGKLVAINQLENERLLLRFENGSSILNTFQTINTDVSTIAISNSDLFKSKPLDFAITDLGYLGSQNEAFISTPFGHIFVDAKRGSIFQLTGTTPKDLVLTSTMRSFFKENLPFTISKYFKNINTDNPFKGIGISLAFDYRFNRLFITKLDYQPLHNGIVLDELTQDFYFNNEKISLRDKSYFCDKSWTVSYSFLNPNFTSFFSFKPNFYIENIDWFMTGLNGLGLGSSSLWNHNLTNKSFQVFYHKLQPFIIEGKTKPFLGNKKVESVEYFIDVVRYHREFDKYYSREQGFNKAIVYTRNQNSGILFLKPNDKSNLLKFLQYPKYTPEGTEIIVNSYKNGYQFNDIENRVKSEENNLPIWISSCNNVDKYINLAAIKGISKQINNNYIEGQDIHVRLINDEESNKKIIVKAININTV